MDITKIATDELCKDLAEGRQDVLDCEAALNAGVLEYSGGLVSFRLKANKSINAWIEAELVRRGLDPASVQPQRAPLAAAPRG
jgi:hypothetical protein